MKQFAEENFPEEIQRIADRMNIDLNAVPPYTVPPLPIEGNTTAEEFVRKIRPELVRRCGDLMYGNIPPQGKELGTYFYLMTGGEPLIRKKDIIKLCEEHNDCVFSAFTNASLIDEDFAKEMLRVQNFIPAISIEGFGDATDARRGEGTYDDTLRAMEILRRNRLPFGISCCYTSANCEVIGSEEYFDKMIEMGAKFAWFFTYMPIGKQAVPSLMATAEQREFMYHQLRRFRSTKPIFTVDFWNDGEYVGGCIAGGRAYLHINANGDVEPCVFVHYSNANIREKTLLECFQQPLFKAYEAKYATKKAEFEMAKTKMANEYVPDGAKSWALDYANSELEVKF